MPKLFAFTTDKPITVDHYREEIHEIVWTVKYGKWFQELDEEIKKLGDLDWMPVFSFSFDLWFIWYTQTISNTFFIQLCCINRHMRLIHTQRADIQTHTKDCHISTGHMQRHCETNPRRMLLHKHSCVRRSGVWEGHKLYVNMRLCVCGVL